MKQIVLIALFSLSANFSFSQTDSTDLNLYTTPPTLMSEMDSLMFPVSDYLDYNLGFTITDTLNFNSLSVEFSSIGGNVLFKQIFTLTELQSKGMIDSNWVVQINFGKFEINQSYKVLISLIDYTGAYQSNISKNY